jgi:hypothetical protein
VGSRIPIPPRGKEIRAEPFAAAWQGGNVYAVAGAWIADFLEEAEPWPGQMFPLGNIRQPRRLNKHFVVRINGSWGRL